ncbi:MAG TPA: hypothetical protein VF915_25895, partial [Reyranella sp.]
RLKQRIDTILEAIDEVPRLLRSLDRMIGDWSRDGVVLHAESLATQAAHRARLLPWLVAPLWLAAAALAVIAMALLVGR